MKGDILMTLFIGVLYAALWPFLLVRFIWKDLRR